jgi:hypothetical protein
MADDRFIKPENKASPKLPVPAARTVQLPRRQAQVSSLHEVVDQGTPQSDTLGKGPGVYTLEWYVLGASAGDIVNDLRTGILDDPDVTTIELGTQGSNTQPEDGVYGLASDDTLDERVSEGSDNGRRIKLQLSINPNE